MKRLVHCLLMIVAALSCAGAQEVFTLERCLTLARTQHPRVRNAQNTIRAAELSHAELMSTKLPQIKFGASMIYAPSFGAFGYDPALSNGGQASGQVIVQQSLYDGGIRRLKSDQIFLDLDRLSKEKRMTERDIVFSVKQAFMEALRSDQEMALEEESARQLGEYLEIVRVRTRAGSAAYTDVLKTELQLSLAELSYQKAADAYAAAKYSLAELIGTPIDSTFRIAGALDASYTPMDSSLLNTNPDSLSNLELSTASTLFQHSLLDIELTQHEKYPTVFLVGDAGLLTSGDNLRLPRDERATMFGYSLGVAVEIPLLHWGATDLRVQQRQLDADNVRLQSELLQRSIMVELRKTRLQMISQRERLHVIQQNIISAEDNFLLTKSKYAGGGSLSLEVLSAQQLLTDTKLSELQTLADLQFLAAKLEQLTTR